MARKTTQEPLEPADKSPLGWAKWWFAMGCQEEGTIRRLREECGLSEADAQTLFQVMIEKLRDEVELAREQVEDRAVAFFRDLKNNVEADWSSRLRAEIELEELLGLPEWAQTDEGRETREVLEAIAFHQHLLASSGPTASQQFRSHGRLLRLLGFQLGRSRRSSAGPLLLRSRTPPRSTGARSTLAVDTHAAREEVSTSRAERTDATPTTGSHAHAERGHGTGDLPPRADPERAADCRQKLAELEREAERLEADVERLVARGLSVSAARNRLDARIQQNSCRRLAVLSQLAGRSAAQLSAHLSRPTPAALAQPPPR